jgi:hypothetical protein
VGMRPDRISPEVNPANRLRCFKLIFLRLNKIFRIVPDKASLKKLNLIKKYNVSQK